MPWGFAMRILLLIATSSMFLNACTGVNKSGGDSSAASADSEKPALTVESVRRFVAKTLSIKNDGPQKLYSFEGFCLDVSGLWFPHLKASGLKGVMQQTSGVGYLDVDGQQVQRSPTHFFIAFNPNTPEEIILDPTYAQFFLDAEKAGLQKVLVEKTSEIHRVYSRYAKTLRVETVGDELTGKYNAKQVSELIYSTGKFKANRTSLD
jgi:hypothetical protein